MHFYCHSIISQSLRVKGSLCFLPRKSSSTLSLFYLNTSLLTLKLWQFELNRNNCNNDKDKDADDYHLWAGRLHHILVVCNCSKILVRWIMKMIIIVMMKIMIKTTMTKDDDDDDYNLWPPKAAAAPVYLCCSEYKILVRWIIRLMKMIMVIIMIKMMIEKRTMTMIITFGPDGCSSPCVFVLLWV